MHAPDLESLIRDARLAADHAARHGKLPAGSRVFAIIDELAGGAKGEKASALKSSLHVELNAIMNAIAPVGLPRLHREDLMGRAARCATAGTTPFIIGMLTFLLTIYLAFQSSELHQADTALREYEEWNLQQPKEKLYAAWKMYRYESVLKAKVPQLAQLDAYQKLVDQAQQLSAKGDAIQQMLNDSASLRYVPRFLEGTGPAWFQRLVARLNQVPVPDDPGAQPESDYKEGDPAGGTAPGQLGCKDVDQPPVIKLKLEPPRDADIDAYIKSIGCFFGRLNIDQHNLDYPVWPVIYQAKSKINLLTVWLLPGLYGLLGACVYLMRQLVVLRTARQRNDRVLMGMLSLLLRITLGGLAGIIIGWFSVPTSEGHTIVPISSIPFGLAFLAGFSIETLFSMLDRINKTVSNQETKPEPPPIAPA